MSKNILQDQAFKTKLKYQSKSPAGLASGILAKYSDRIKVQSEKDCAAAIS